ncbi:xanthine dehydrogenase YagS FAD-binding subunit [Mycolicibacterium iranicum]|uniref:Xanthine dehydrogenase YagS FAD-binding subunit n=1 Tax=Mycolicibacterium iranicum TaxID=912594 RepID=A0A839Q5M2_MYCIR|nr:xanthine dehydrogenase family protein subunit M [Mycolicibacterium iranicum]MBB2991538.1 xanthine dehydrogenase YagS FAD-binding subunit [Mycolicibacterium iranicum]
MKTFDYHRATTVGDAIEHASAGARFYAGGTNLLDLMKSGVESPDALVDVGRLGLGRVEETADGGILIGSGVTNTAAANHPLVRTRYPVLSQAILSGATTQIRNMATVGGNLMQRTRCPYFMDPAAGRCNKRAPGSGCAAREGFSREHAVFGTSLPCVAVHPSDMAVALAALDAVVHVEGGAGQRAIPLREFYLLPGAHPERDTTVEAGELITRIELPATPYGRHSWYLKVRDRHSYAFALVSVAACLHVRDGVIAAAAVAVGGVAATPWRVPAAEAALVGRVPDRAVFADAAEALVHGAAPLSQNGFKVMLMKNSVVRALSQAARR